MAKVNEGMLAIPPSYLFKDIADRVAAFELANPKARPTIRMGIGDVTLPLAKEIVDAGCEGFRQMGEKNPGYPVEIGEEELRDLIAYTDFQSKGVAVGSESIFISTGCKEDSANFPDVFSPDTPVITTSPAYPVYVNAALIQGRRVILVPATKENGFMPGPPTEVHQGAAIYLCSPNNPTGAAYSRDILRDWVGYATKNSCVIIYDTAYEAFISSEDTPHSIFELAGAWQVAVEMRSLSKRAGFTGGRFAYTIIGNAKLQDSQGNWHFIRGLWKRRQGYKTNGVAYPISTAAAAAFTEEGLRATVKQVAYYKNNAQIILNAIRDLGYYCVGGTDAPYVWVQAPNGMGSWEFFDLLLNKCQVVCTPGEGFGDAGEGYIRFSAFGSREDTTEGMERMAELKEVA